MISMKRKLRGDRELPGGHLEGESSHDGKPERGVGAPGEDGDNTGEPESQEDHPDDEAEDVEDPVNEEDVNGKGDGPEGDEEEDEEEALPRVEQDKPRLHLDDDQQDAGEPQQQVGQEGAKSAGKGKTRKGERKRLGNVLDRRPENSVVCRNLNPRSPKFISDVTFCVTWMSPDFTCLQVPRDATWGARAGVFALFGWSLAPFNGGGHRGPKGSELLLHNEMITQCHLLFIAIGGNLGSSQRLGDKVCLFVCLLVD